MTIFDLINYIHIKKIGEYITSYSTKHLDNIIKFIDMACPVLIDSSYNQHNYDNLEENDKKLLHIFFTLLEVYQEDSNKCYGFLVNSSELIIIDKLHESRLKAIKMIRKINTSTCDISEITNSIISITGQYESTKYNLDTISNHKILSSLIIINLYNSIKNQTAFNEKTGDSVNKILTEIVTNCNIYTIKDNLNLIISYMDDEGYLIGKKLLTKKLLF